MSDAFSWGSDKDVVGRVINAESTDLWLTPIATDEDLALIAQRCKKLETLSLFSCWGLTDAGVLHLSSITRLIALNVGNTHITENGTAAFRAAQKEAKNAEYEALHAGEPEMTWEEVMAKLRQEKEEEEAAAAAKQSCATAAAADVEEEKK